MVTLEHRYFGLSLPFGNESYTTENLQYFTLENVMADAVTFMDIVKKNVTGAEASKVIVVGGAYSYITSSPLLSLMVSRLLWRSSFRRVPAELPRYLLWRMECCRAIPWIRRCR